MTRRFLDSLLISVLISFSTAQPQDNVFKHYIINWNDEFLVRKEGLYKHVRNYQLVKTMKLSSQQSTEKLKLRCEKFVI